MHQEFENLMRWAVNISDLLATDKSNDWSVELAELYEILEVEI